MRQLVFLFVLFSLFVFGAAMAEDGPVASPAPSVSPSAEATPAPTPKPELAKGMDADGLVLSLDGPIHFNKEELGATPFNVGFKLAVTGEAKSVTLNSNPFKVLSLELCHDDSRDKIVTPSTTPEDGTEFSMTLGDGSYYGGSFKSIEKYFSFEEGGRFWIRATFTLGEKKAVSDWTAIDIYTRVIVRIKTREGEFSIWLRFDKAPKTAQNFLDLVNKGWYDHKIFHRVENQPNFKLIQGGCPHGDGSGGPGYTIPWEDSDLKHEAGSVAMGLNSGRDRKPVKDSAGCQFYVCCEPIPSLDGNYCVFGTVVEGLEVVKKIAAVRTDPQKPNRPQMAVEMETLTVEYRK